MLRIFTILIVLFSFSICDDFSGFEEEYEAPKTTFDPLRKYNVFMTNVNDKIFTNVINPVAKGYASVVDSEIRMTFSNFFDNLMFPVRFVNNILQGKFKNSGEELFRFVVNTTIGVGGFGDAGELVFGIKAHPEDFGQTLGYYGVKSGFPIVLPILGPSNVRDLVGFGGDYFLNPLSYMENTYISIGAKGFSTINNLSFHMDEIETARKNVINLYPFLQGYYESSREKMISE